MKTGIELITKERTRQINEEGYTLALDSLYKPGELTSAAICYAIVGGSSPRIRESVNVQASMGLKPNGWPWSVESWKPGQDHSVNSRVRELTKAGALLDAEIDRLLNMQ